MKVDPDKVPTPEELRELLEEERVTQAAAARLVQMTPDNMRRCALTPDRPRHRKLSLASWELLLLKLNRHPNYVLIDKPKKS